MNYPKRTAAHVQETASVKRLESALPDPWMIRHVTERDYGLDCILELVPRSGDMLGYMAAIQLKSTESLAWKAGGGEVAAVSGIKVSTVNYWRGIPMPVFLAVHERASDRLYFSPVNRLVRSSFTPLLTQESMSFVVHREWELTSDDGIRLFAKEALRQLQYPRFSSAMLDLLYGAQRDVETLLHAVELDSFMAVEDDVFAGYVRILRHAAEVASFTDLDWPVKPLGHWFQVDRENWGDDGYYLHNGTFDKAVADLAESYARVLRAGRKIVLDRERSYWEHEDELLVHYCESWQAEDALQQVDRLVEYVRKWREDR